MSRTRTLAALALAAMLLLVPAGAQAATKTVTAGPPVSKPPKGVPPDADTNAFYRKTVTVHVGDKVRWQINGFHTVTFPAKGKKPPPFISVDPTTKISGANDAAGVPFWFNGQDRLILDPLGAFPVGGKSYKGTTLTSAGAPLSQGRPKPYTLKFTKAGTFRYVCTIHTPYMKGTVKVVARSKAIPSAAADKRAVKAQFAAAVAQVKKADKFAGPSGNAVQVGNDTRAVAMLRFFPQTKAVPVGTTVTLSLTPTTSEIHTFSFGPEAYLMQQSVGFVTPDPSKTPPVLVFNPLIAFPSDPPPAVPAFTGANHGNGFLSTGVLDQEAATPSPPSAQIRFDTAGTYGYHCLIHPEMKGQIVVG